ncbi:MAG: hypothetical protein ACI959_000385 [Limisphaerales bacterium]|jgi:hypothetical protein
MKKILLLISCSLILWNSCTTDFDVNAEFKEVAVVYGLLDLSETTNYIRINRAFLQDDVSALLLAEDPDQIYYDERLEVSVEEYAGSTRIGTYALDRVSGDSLGLPKNTGIFANVPNILYRLERELNPDNVYRLRATSTELEIDITAETPIINDFNVSKPNPNPGPSTSLNFATLSDFQVRWNNGKNAKIYDLQLLVFYHESDVLDIDNVIKDSVLNWTVLRNKVVTNPEGSAGLDFDISRNGFYSFLNSEFNADDAVVRFVDSLQFRFLAGSETLYQYIQFNEAQLGLSANDITAEFTNVEGGIGLFASRYNQYTPKYRLSNQSLDTVGCGRISGGLNFAPSPTYPFFPFCQ